MSAALKTITTIFISITFMFTFFVLTAFAAGEEIKFVPLVGIPLPGGTDDQPTSLIQYVNAIYLTLIVLGALFGVMKIALAGVKYSLSDVVTNKESAKSDIKGVLLGLFILVIPFIVLNTIYEGLTDLKVLDEFGGELAPTSYEQALVNNAPGAPPTEGSDAPAQNVTENMVRYQCPDEASCASYCDTHNGTVSRNGGNHICTYDQNAPEARDLSLRYPQSGDRIVYVNQNIDASALQNMTDAQKRILTDDCSRKEGRLTIAYGCTKIETLTCEEGKYFLEGICVPRPRVNAP